MANETTNGGAGDDVSARRLLDAIGASDIEYFSAAQERVIAEALQSWPLLATISQALVAERVATEAVVRRASAPAASADPPLRVLEALDPLESIEEADLEESRS